MKLRASYLFFALFLLTAVACTNDELPPSMTPEFCDDIDAFYTTNVKPIMDESCAYAGCHDGAGGIGPGDYTNYASLSTYLDTRIESVRNRVFEIADNPSLGMPPDQSVYPFSQKDDLTEEEMNILECWLDAGYPE
ncbi:MAG: hypothetical protein AAFZ15_14325 [Bacteroidota bacterium]